MGEQVCVRKFQQAGSVVSHAIQVSRKVRELRAIAVEPLVQPGEAAACAYCPICQAIALFRSVPMTTWQRLAASVVEVADAARDVANTAAPPSAPIVVTPVAPADDTDSATVADLLADLAAPESDPEAQD